MIRLLREIAIAALLLAAAALAVLRSADPPRQVPLVRADWPSCVVRKQPPLPAPKLGLGGRPISELT